MTLTIKSKQTTYSQEDAFILKYFFFTNMRNQIVKFITLHLFDTAAFSSRISIKQG